MNEENARRRMSIYYMFSFIMCVMYVCLYAHTSKNVLPVAVAYDRRLYRKSNGFARLTSV